MIIKPKKQDLMIIYYAENAYRVSMRKKIFWFIKKWVPITYQETENSPEVPLQFRTFDEATDFINAIT